MSKKKKANAANQATDKAVEAKLHPPTFIKASQPMMYFSLLDAVHGFSEPKKRPDPWTGLGDLLASIEDMESGVRELPEPPQDMTSYHDAFRAAAKACRHENYEDTMYAKREARCNDCGRYFTKPRSLFSW